MSRYPGGLRAKLLARDWTNVKLFCWLPADLPDELLEPMDASFVVRLGRSHLIDRAYVDAEVGYIQAHLAARTSGVFLYQADYLRLEKGLPIVCAAGEHIIVVDRDVGADDTLGIAQEAWIYVNRAFDYSEDVMLAMHRGKWPQHGLGVLTESTDAMIKGEVSELVGSDAVSELCSNARVVLVPAWRGDAFVIVEWI